MTSHYNQLTLEDRRQIYRLRDQKVSINEIAARLGRHRSTVYREIQRNTFLKDDDGYYDGYFPVTANDLAQARRVRKRKLLQQEQLRRYVIKKLESCLGTRAKRCGGERKNAPGRGSCRAT